MRQSEIELPLRHQHCRQANVRFLKIRVVLESSFKKLSCLIELIILTVNFRQLIDGVGHPLISFFFYLF